jgi:Sigma-70, region 4
MLAREVVTAFAAGYPGGCARPGRYGAGPGGRRSEAAPGRHSEAAPGRHSEAGPGRTRIRCQQTARPALAKVPGMTAGSSPGAATPDPGAPRPSYGSRALAAGSDSARTELCGLFEDAAAGLNLGDREVIELQLRQGLEAGELATVLGVSRGHAHQLLARAREQLECCLGVLVVVRSGRGECGELRTLVADWDGQLTAQLRTRVHRHIERCATCTARRAQELRPARLLNLSPGAALAAGAAESFRLARRAPAALRSRTMALAAGRGPGAAARRSAVLARAGTFGRRGFPEPTRADWAGLAGPCGLGAVRIRLRTGLRACRRTGPRRPRSPCSCWPQWQPGSWLPARGRPR